MLEKSVAIIVDFIVGSFPESTRTTAVTEAVKSYVLGKTNFDFVSTFCESTTGTSEPIKRLKKIIDSCTRSASSTPKNPLPGKKTRPWTQVEDNRLLAGILKFGEDNWAQISKFVGNGRTRPQCAQRFFRALDPKISKETWSDEEDKRLLELIKEYGEKKWTQIGDILGNRTDVQCRYRYKQLQRKMVGSTKSGHQSVTAAKSLLYAMNSLAEQSSPELVPVSCNQQKSSEAEEHIFDENLASFHEENATNSAYNYDTDNTMFFDHQVESIFSYDDDLSSYALF